MNSPSTKLYLVSQYHDIVFNTQTRGYYIYIHTYTQPVRLYGDICINIYNMILNYKLESAQTGSFYCTRF